MADVWHISTPSGTTEHASVPLAFAEMDRLVRSGATGVTFRKKQSVGKTPDVRPGDRTETRTEESGQVRMGF